MLSTIKGTPAECAMAAIASMSVMMPPGLAMLSMNTALVLGVIAAANSSGLVASTNFACQSNFAKLWLNWLIEPP